MEEIKLSPDLENIYFRLKSASDIEEAVGFSGSSRRISLGSECRLNYSATSFARSKMGVGWDEIKTLEELIEDSRDLIEENKLSLMENPGLLMSLGLVRGKRDFVKNMGDLSWIICPPFRASTDFSEISDLDLINEGHPVLGYRLAMTVDQSDNHPWVNILFTSDDYFVLVLDYGRHFYCSGVLPTEQMSDEEGRIITHYLQMFNHLSATIKP